MKKPYSPPTLKELTPEQAKKLVANRKNCSEEDATDLLNSLKRPQQREYEQAPDNELKRPA